MIASSARTPRFRLVDPMWRAAAVAVVSAGMIAATGCSSGDASTRPAVSTMADPTTTSASAAPTSAAPAATVPTTAVPTTAVPTTGGSPSATFATPAAAGTAVYGAWTKGDRASAGALNLAPPAELDKLFAAVPLPAAKNRGCDEGEFDAANCFFGNGQGGVNITLVPVPGGWSVDTIDPFG